MAAQFGPEEGLYRHVPYEDADAADQAAQEDAA